MTASPATRLAAELARPRFTGRIGDLAAAFHDQTVTYRLRGCGASAPAGIGAHLRRSFLGALGPGASPAAAAGQPCTWDPPCALDVFCREQLRGPKGDGLPKPYVIRALPHRGDLIVGLRVFGMANDWFMAAAEAMAIGLRTILPWHHLYPGRTSAPALLDRSIAFGALPVLPGAATGLRLHFLTPTDTGGSDPGDRPHRILTRMLRRIDGLSRWNGLALDPEAGRAFASFAQTLDYDTSGLRLGRHDSPNARKQVRRKLTMTGALTVTGDIAPLWPVVAMCERAHLGRGAVEGLGVVGVEPLQVVSPRHHFPATSGS